MKKIIASAILSVVACFSVSAMSHAELGDSAYAKNAFAEALEFYNSALQSEGSSSNLYYNIGNTYYRLNDLGHAVISYERALKIDPSNADARTNLEFVNTKILDKPEDDSTFLSNLHNSILGSMSPDAWAWMAFAIFVIFAGAVALYMFTRNVTARKTGFFGGIVLLVIFVYVLVVARSAANAIDSHDSAVVIVPTTNLRSVPASPKSKTDKVVPIHEGTRLEIVDSLSTPDDPGAALWYDVKINNTTRAWVNAADVERI